MKSDRKKYVHIRIPAWERHEVPDGFMGLAEHRTEHLQGMMMRETLRYLLACAYAQGVTDAAWVIDRTGGPAGQSRLED